MESKRRINKERVALTTLSTQRKLEGECVMPTIYSTNYRKIWEEHYGSIPIDEDGRSYEIHHIDGNRNNNSIENLLCVSIKEHFEIHYEQKDYGACSAISFRMAKTPDELSALQSMISTLSNQKRLDEGTHNFNDPEWREKYFDNKSAQRVREGTHNFLEPGFQSSVQKKRLKNGTHNFNSDSAKQRERKKKEECGPLVEKIKMMKKEKDFKLPKNWHGRNKNALQQMIIDLECILK